MKLPVRQFPLVLLAAVFPLLSVAAAPPSSVEFFENRIRPVLVEHCYQCHSSQADEVGGSLMLDSRDGMMAGGDSGPAIQLGDATASMLISAIRYESTEMPPDGRLPEPVIADFEQWIDAGAIDPRTEPASAAAIKSQIDIEAGRQFWAFRPISLSPSSVQSGSSADQWIDQYVDARLSESALSPVGQASPEVRLRRLCFDLTGLPPDQQLMRRWESDPSPAHWQRIVDELLASPAYGEHWARHWMDVARYADSNGADFNATFHEAWRYRDYLIRSFAADRPIDQMIRQQVAGDLLPAADDEERSDNVVASTFLMLGTKMLSERDKAKLTLDVVDEQIDTVGRAFLGLTLGCARCHDHKFDPVPTEDYYALAGIFRSTLTLNGESQKYVSTWNRVPLPTSDQHVAAIKRHAADVKSLEQRIEQAQEKLKALQQRSGSSLAGIVIDDRDAETTGSWMASTYFKHFVGAGYIHDNNKGKGDAQIRFATRLPNSGNYEVRLSHSPGSTRAAAVPITITTADGDKQLFADQRQVKIEPMWSSLGVFRFSADADAVVVIGNEGTNGYVIADAIQFLPQSEVGPSDPEATGTQADAARLQAAKDRVEQLQAELKQWQAAAPDPLPEAMAPGDRGTDQVADSPVHIRGEVNNLGPIVPRGFLQVCSNGKASIGRPLGSGRIALADWLTDPDNPLVSRVFVNRVWMHLMGEGIVRTVDNFGFQGQRPTHPELLDALATQFVRDGWRLKPLVRQIVISDAYNRSSQFHPQAAAVDPENRLLWRMHRRRLPAESIRDAMLIAAGQLDRTPRREPMKGRGVLVSSNNADSQASFDDVGDPCRTIYLPIVRGYLPALLTKLDIAEPDLLVGKRPTTNVPAQALVLVNSPDVNRWTRATAERVVDQETSLQRRIELAYRICLQRDPSDQDRTLATDFVTEFESQRPASVSPDQRDAWHELVAALMASTEFRLLE